MAQRWSGQVRMRTVSLCPLVALKGQLMAFIRQTVCAGLHQIMSRRAPRSLAELSVRVLADSDNQLSHPICLSGRPLVSSLSELRGATLFTRATFFSHLHRQRFQEALLGLDQLRVVGF